MPQESSPQAPASRNFDSCSSSGSSSSSDAATDPNLRRKAIAMRTIALASAIVGSLGAGSVTAFSLYGHLFQSRLHYSQFQINGIASAMNIAMYLPVPIVGYICDHFGPGVLSLTSTVLVGGGYALAAVLYQKGLREVGSHQPGGKTTFAPMVFAFVAIGVGTSCLYLSSVTTCAKNFGKSKYRSLLLVAPIAAFGLSGMIISQCASRLLYETLPDGTRGDLNVLQFFLFLSLFLAIVGIIGSFTLRVVNEEDLIGDAAEGSERSGLLENGKVCEETERTYGTTVQCTSPEAVYAKPKKTQFLNAETRDFLADPTMWLLAVSFWLIIGPGESFINNLGTVIATLNSPSESSKQPSAATHVSIMAAVSTIARLAAASLSDLLSPAPESQHAPAGLPHSPPGPRPRLQISRVVLYVAAALLFSVGTVTLASGVVQEHADRFWIVSGSIGAGYGAVFSLTPIIITIVWGVENFGTNYGIIALTPALGSLVWGIIYATVYQAGTHNPASPQDDASAGDSLCYGNQCYATTFWAMTASVWIGAVMILLAWKGRSGWSSRGIVI
ncbi:major facilitator superfamily domain-containing protein [Xylaria intraflava]|nr:major facilitator superfamily domain-containing protein [Xylaria intraflava]